MNRNLWAAIAATIAVAGAITLGFLSSGSPARERQRHQDARTVQALYVLADELHTNWPVGGKLLPPNLGFYASTAKDPTTHATFIYHHKDGTAYELCTTFLTNDLNDSQSETPFWRHGKGVYCFQFDASQDPPAAPVSITY